MQNEISLSTFKHTQTQALSSTNSEVQTLKYKLSSTNSEVQALRSTSSQVQNQQITFKYRNANLMSFTQATTALNCLTKANTGSKHLHELDLNIFVRPAHRKKSK